MSTAPPTPALDFLWAEITGHCQLNCGHCYADSGPAGTHGSMTLTDWITALDQAAQLGARMVQFIGGEPTLHPDLRTLITCALGRRLHVEVYSNLVHVSPALWEVFAQPGVRLATSYYTDDPEQHLRITGRPSLHRTRSNIAQAVTMGIPIRVGIIDIHDGQRIDQAMAQLADLGVTRVGIDHVRLLGRPAHTPCDASELCGRCGDGVAAILPDGSVIPCPMSRWLSAGNVRTAGLPSLVAATRQLSHQQILPAVNAAGSRPCEPNCTPGCNPGVNEPGGGDGCTPKQKCTPNQPVDPQCNPNFKCQPKQK
ncbi:radical SAM/SPASM domain-containing protein [Nonomuraea typhae]|uniref:radical SAM/SPASM domain-containing protein n=1 Tax=Nonomuraea typhae TaxID=2603600 RepID=UPI0012FC81FD|nr:radical SAM/SPASM domain-containing protein [Nonomuraea typhae]